jgi:hypothetical protein
MGFNDRQLGAFEPWMEALWNVLSTDWFAKTMKLRMDTSSLPFKFDIRWLDDDEIMAQKLNDLKFLNMEKVILRNKERLTSVDHFQDVEELEFVLPSSMLYSLK